MEVNDILQLNRDLQGLYGERYAGMTNDMTRVWYKHLRHFPAELVPQVLERWAVTHQLYQLPTLEDLASLMERLQEERRRAGSWRQSASDGPQGEPFDDFDAAAIKALIEKTLPGTFPELHQYDLLTQEGRE